MARLASARLWRLGETMGARRRHQRAEKCVARIEREGAHAGDDRAQQRIFQAELQISEEGGRRQMAHEELVWPRRYNIAP